MKTQFQFAQSPAQSDFEILADYVESLAADHLSPLLQGKEEQIAARLREMGHLAGRADHQSAYHMLRLFIR